MMIHTVTAVPRPRISTKSGVSATSGMVWLTSATGKTARAKAGVSRPATASAKPKAIPAAIPASVIGRVSATAASNRSCALGALSDRNG